MAGALAFREGCARVGSALLEPVMKVEVHTPDSFLGEIGGDIARRRGTLNGIDDCAGGKILRAELPLAGMFGYATGLRSISQGRATYSMVFGKYAEVPVAALPVDE
jgi:elongation factor G